MPVIIDLTMPIADHFRWRIDRRLTRSFPAGDPFQVTWAGWSVHAFTHVDAPRHMLPDGAPIDELDLGRVVGDCAVLDLCGRVRAGVEIGAGDLAAVGAHARTGDILLLKTAWERHHPHTMREFWTQAPWLRRAAAEWLGARRPAAVAFDFPQDFPIRLLLDNETRPMEEFVTHDVLLRRGVTLIEYLCGTASITRPRVTLCALPLKLAGADGAPARVIVME
jgi:arylformamidase